ncbi:MAG: FCD domain-containing protein [Thermoleophilia bacterium]|nr:FCD domain-containing protein [Thermoleophilia bacterium]
MTPRSSKERVLRVPEVVDRLRARIHDGEYVPGDRLPAERVLAAELGVARETLRQALNTLREEDYLEPRRGGAGGWFVRDLDEASRRWLGETAEDGRRLREILEIRLALESYAAALAAERRGDHDLKDMRAALEEFRQALEEVSLAGQETLTRADAGSPLHKAGSQFHAAVGRASGNERLMAAIRQARADLFAASQRTIRRDLALSTLQDHEAVFAAILAGDSAAASAAMSAHLDRGRKRAF